MAIKSLVDNVETTQPENQENQENAGVDTVSNILNREILDLLANSPEFVAEIKKTLELNTALYESFTLLREKFQENLAFSQEHAKILSELANAFDTDYRSFVRENELTKRRIEDCLTELDAQKQENIKFLEKIKATNLKAEEIQTNLDRILAKITDVESYEREINALVDSIEGHKNDLEQTINTKLQDAQTQLEEKINAAFLELQEKIQEEASVQMFFDKLDKINASVGFFIQNTLNVQAKAALTTIQKEYDAFKMGRTSP
ncbi:hypothetical protein LS70_003870 [Helicobacter sp. MIT 11-5569]|uniref:hypothetical protein n=1 Tax=Helicobacter sp. MIT 11-5569 TaxID=1548151 RepID=UPI00051FE17C|nr:hypothetical protein [Helicobacter sp. MIT 11-5569]TLD83956.1 hypothetical protein LS70_003870 [Helicobacter sp. MIT 11-5569]